ncbi:PRMT5 arginine-N-methyltransferase-domain-containing protein [Xylariomycetidae sp. FL0641]|nr:PRMT5 arginine-N-methyltransferase-domain-containing protein [Xylariomycetidae sp. FL0641]
MAREYADAQSEGYDEPRPIFYIGQHDSTRTETLTDLQYGQVLNSGFSFVTTPITNEHFHQRIVKLLDASLSNLAGREDIDSLPDPIVPPLTTEDTNLFPGTYTSGMIAYSSSWIDLCSSNPTISSISRQVLNLEVAYANFCGVRYIMIPGPRRDTVDTGSSQGVAQFARAVQETLLIGTRVNIIIHLPMYREPGLEEKTIQLSASEEKGNEAQETQETQEQKEIDLFGVWDSWHVIRTACDYDTRLLVALKIPRVLPEKDLQTRWFSEPLQYLTLGPRAFQTNKAGHPTLSRFHQQMIGSYMRLKNAPYFLLCDVGPEVQAHSELSHELNTSSKADFPSLADAATNQSTKSYQKVQSVNAYASYLRHVERQQEPLSMLEQNTLTNFQDWLQPPLQPLSDNLESATYEVFEGDPVKYNQYEQAITEALRDWKDQGKPTSSSDGAVVIAVAGSGRGPLVTRALRASDTTGVPVKVWAVEKNPNAYVYLLRQNERAWGGRVTVVKTDMRAWKGPSSLSSSSSSSSSSPSEEPGKVDILVSELLGSFGDNELSPECLDGIQHVLAPGHGISIPASYTAHLSPVAHPRLHADISQRPDDPHAASTPWVVRLYQQDFVAARAPDRPRFQTAWAFRHPLPPSTLEAVAARRAGGVAGGGGGSMAGAAGANDHNARACHLTFVCRARGAVHGLAGYFESVLYQPAGADPDTGARKEPVELSILPENIQRKSRDMISWFPIFFPLKTPLYFPPDSELEVSMWRQTDDTKVWYEWMVEAFMWIGPTQRVKVGGSELCSSRKVACLM